MLRGGALFASLMTATPLWSSIDPIRVVGVGKSDDDLSADDSAVERVFE